MIKFEKPEVWGWEHAIRGMRNPLNSWERSDSYPAVDCGKCGIIDREGICHPKEHDCTPYECYAIGDNDKDLMTRLIRGGTPHRKFLRQIFVSVDITAPLYWWKEFDTYKVGTTANSCSTMHKIQAKEFTFEDFSCEHLDEPSKAILGVVINELNNNRGWYNDYNRLVSEGDFADVERILKGGQTSPRYAQVDVSVDNRGSVTVVVASGEDAVWVEFGAGVYHNGSPGSSPHPHGAELGMTIGGFGKGNGKKEVWGFYENGEFKLSRGTPARMPMALAITTVCNDIQSIAKEVFG